MQTTAPGVWAIGEVAGSPQFTHISIDDFRVVHANLTGSKRVTTGRQVPYCLFTDPELARIGLSETEAEAQGIPYRLFKVPMETNLRARTLSETRGFLKALVEARSDRILGFTAFAVGAGEILAAVQINMIAELPYNALRDAVRDSPNTGRRSHISVLIRVVSAQHCRDKTSPEPPPHEVNCNRNERNREPLPGGRDSRVGSMRADFSVTGRKGIEWIANPRAESRL